jgi:tetratricopeptide (TPR) repeat protein
MRTLIAVLLIIFPFLSSLGQSDDDARNSSIKAGIALHDKGDYEGAIKIYDEIIKKDPHFFLAQYEKSLSLLTAGKYQDCADLSREILKKFPKDEEILKVYSNYGTALDYLQKPDEAIKIYSEGIKKFPANYNLYYNRGITQYIQKDIEKAIQDFKKSVSLKPMHASSHLYLAYCMQSTNKVASIMSLSTFLILEPTGKRAESGLQLLSGLLGSNVKKKDEKNIVISMTPDLLDTKSKKEDDFHITELTLTLGSALDLEESKKDINIAEKMKGKLDVIGVINDSKKKGFFTSFYVPFFKEMHNDSLMRTAAYIMHASTNDQGVRNWLDENKSQVEKFYMWLNKYAWRKEDK